MVSELNGNLVVRFTDYGTSEPFLSILGLEQITESVQTLIEYSASSGLPASLLLMPKTTVDQISSFAIAICEDRDNHDYIYEIRHLVAFNGSHFQTIRYKSNKFRRRNPDAVTSLVDLNTKEIQDQILAVVSTWKRNKIRDEKNYEIEHELEAMRRFFSNSIDENFVGIGIRYLDGLIGFIVLEILPSNYSICHFWKCDTQFSGIYEFLKQESAKILIERGVQFLNFEQDLGIPNLRQAKMNFRPSSFLKKYQVKLIA